VEVIGWGNAGDANGFVVTVAGQARPVAWDGTTTFDSLTASTVVASLSGTADHCQADSTARTRELVEGRVDTVRFAVGCFGDLVYHEWLGHAEVRIHYIDTLGIDHRLGGNAGRQVAQEWAPDGERLLIHTNERGNLDPLNYEAYDVGVISRSGGSTTWIGRSDFGEFWPRWASDGQRIVYNRRFGRGGWLDSMSIRVANADGTNDIQLVSPMGTDVDPVWVLGGSAVVYGCFRHPGPGLCRTGVAGGSTGLLASALGIQHVFSSPDGEWVAYEAAYDRQDMWIVPAQGGTPRRIDPSRTTYWGAWSPGSERLLYSTVEESSPSYVYGVRIHDRTTGGISENLAAFVTNHGGYSWNSNGSWLALSAVVGADQQIYVLRADGAGRQKVTNAPGTPYAPLWRNKSRFVEPPSWVSLIGVPGDPAIRTRSARAANPGRCVGWEGPRMGVHDCAERGLDLPDGDLRPR
jgi:Tol biopolymer transport system component